METKQSDKALLEKIESLSERHDDGMSPITEFRRQFYQYLRARNSREERRDACPRPAMSGMLTRRTTGA